MNRLTKYGALGMLLLAPQPLAHAQQAESQQAQDPPANNVAEPPSANNSDVPTNPQEVTPGERPVPSQQGSQIGQNAINQASGDQGSGIYAEDTTPWFDNDFLREELELDEDQIRRLNDAYGNTWRQLRGEGGSADGAGEGLAEDARARRTDRLRNRFDDEFARNTHDIFRDDVQRNRFNQLSLQRQGYSAFDNPRLQRELNLNDTQRRQLQDLNRSWSTELDALRGTYASDRAGTSRRFNELRDRTRTQFDGILNEQQRTAYDEMIGDQFDFGADSFLGSNDARTARRDSTGSGLGTPQNRSQGSGLGTPQNRSQGSGLGTPAGGTATGSGLDTPQGGTNTGTGAGTGAGAGAGAGTGATGSGSGAGSGSASGSSSSGGSGGSGGGGSGS